MHGARVTRLTVSRSQPLAFLLWNPPAFSPHRFSGRCSPSPAQSAESTPRAVLLATPHCNPDLLKHVHEVLCNAHNYLSPTPFSLSRLEMLSLIHSFQLLQLDFPHVFTVYHLCILSISQHSCEIKIFAISDTNSLQFSCRHESRCPYRLRSDFRIWLNFIFSKALSYLLTCFQH